jgi:hypothetical protein
VINRSLAAFLAQGAKAFFAVFAGDAGRSVYLRQF